MKLLNPTARHLRRTLRWGALLALLAAGTVPARSRAQQSASNTGGQDGVLAIVNDDTITTRHIGNEAMRRYGSEVVDSMVDRYLVLQACQQAGIEITAEDVEGEIERTARKFGLSRESYLQLLQEERDIAPDQYRSEVVWPMLALRALVAEQIQITQEEFNKAFIARFGEAVKCRMIMMQDRDKLAAVRREAIADPSRFGQLAAQHSEDEVSASVRGLIPPIRHHMGDPALETLAFSLEEEEISEVHSLGDTWIVLQCVRRLDPTPPSEEAFPAIRDQIVDRLRDEKVRGEATALFANLREKAKVVKVYGDAQLSQQYPGVAAIINDQQLTMKQATAQAIKRHGEEIVEGEINRSVLRQALEAAGLKVTAADLDAEVARAAVSFGYVDDEGNADVASWREVALQGADEEAFELYKLDAVWPSVALKKLVGQPQVTEEEIQQGFQKNFGPRVEVLAIVLGDQRTAQRVWDMARENPSEEYFGELAAQYSIEPTSQSNFGKVPPIRQYGGQPTIEKEAFSLRDGEMSGVIAAGDKYIILRCQGRTEPLVGDLEAVRDELVREIKESKQRGAMAQKFDELKGSAKIYNFLEGEAQTPGVARQPGGAAQRR
jgi:parvulin-like peptidyl-prolyl isomerase